MPQWYSRCAVEVFPVWLAQRYYQTVTTDAHQLTPIAPASEPYIAILPHRTLVTAARHRHTDEMTGCEVLLSMIIAERHVRAVLHRIMAKHDLSEYRFSTLLSLFALDPMMPTAADLAFHSNVSRSAMTEILDQLEQKRWVLRRRHAEDRRVILIEITEAGRTVTAEVIRVFLDATDALTRDFPSALKRSLFDSCNLLCKQTPKGSVLENLSLNESGY